MAGLLAGLLLADQGATVTRVTGGSEVEGIPAWLLRGKELFRPDGPAAEELAALVGGADVVLEPVLEWTDQAAFFLPATVPLAATTIRLRLTDLGSGANQPTTWVGASGAVAAATGLFTDVSIPGRVLRAAPIYTGLPLPAVYGAVHGAAAVVAAVYARERTGNGAELVVSLRAAMLSAMGSSALRVAGQPWRYDTPPLPKRVAGALLPLLRLGYRVAGPAGRQRLFGRVRGLIPPLMNTYACADGERLYVFAMDNGDLTRRLLRELGLLEAMRRAGVRETDPFASPPDRDNLLNASTLSTKWKSWLHTELTRVLATRPAVAWEHQLNAAGVPCAVHRSLAEWLALPELAAAGLTVPAATGMAPGPAAWVGDAPERVKAPATGGGDEPPPLSGSEAGPSERATHAPLAGIRVLDLSSMVAGPACGRTLADYGAEVIKLDAPRPRHGPLLTNWYAIDLNRGKQTLVLDLATPEGQTALARLVAGADVLLHNMRPAAAQRLGLDAASLHRLNPQLVVTTLSAYDGPRPAARAAWPGYDPVLQAASGIMTRYGTAATPELHAIASCIDYLTGYLAVFGTLLALRRRAQTGRGARAKTALASAALYAQASYIQDPDPVREALPSSLGPTALCRLYQARDGWVFLGAGPDQERVVRQRLGLPPAGPVDWANPVGQWAGQLAGALRALSGAEVLTRLEATGAAVARVVALDELLATSDEAARREPAHPSGYAVTSLQPAYCRWNGTPIGPGPAVAALGHDTRTVLGAVGFGAAELADWQRRGIIQDRLTPVYLPA